MRTMRSHWGIIRCIAKSKHMRVSRFNTLWGFWRDLIHNFAAVSPLDRKKINNWCCTFCNCNNPYPFFYFLRRLLGFPHIFDPSVTQHPFFKSTLLLIIWYTAVCKVVTDAPPAFRDDTKNGCVADYSPYGCAKRQSLCESHLPPKNLDLEWIDW